LTESRNGSSSAPRAYTFEEMMAVSQSTGGAVIPVGLGGVAPIPPRGMLVDSSGVVWSLPGQPPGAPAASAAAPASPADPVGAPAGGPAGTAAGVAVDPREVAVEVLHEVPLPDIRLRMNPELGLVALPSWFWVEGYGGESIARARTVEIPPLVGPEVPLGVVPAGDPRRRGRSFTVEVRVWPTRYEWSFGDGTALGSRTLGQQYPQESEVRHTYEHSSLRTADGFPVRLTVAFAAEFRVDGGPPQGLPPTHRTYETRYRVQEIQTVLTGR
jgi:hypothetical protein